MIHVTNLLFRIILRMVRYKIKSEVSNDQCGSVEGKGTNNTIYIRRTILDKAAKVKRDVFLRLIN